MKIFLFEAMLFAVKYMERYKAITLTSIALFEKIVFMLIVEWFPLLLILLCRSLSYENC